MYVRIHSLPSRVFRLADGLLKKPLKNPLAVARGFLFVSRPYALYQIKKLEALKFQVLPLMWRNI